MVTKEIVFQSARLGCVTPSAQAVGRGMLVWLFAILTSAQTMAASIIAAHERNAFSAVVWLATTFFVFFVATSLENVKQFLEESLV